MKIFPIFLLLAFLGCQQSDNTAGVDNPSTSPSEEGSESEEVTEEIPYGNNPEAGAYFTRDGVKLYYEIYGSGKPILMLHGGVYGYIDEFSPFIPKLAENHQVICLATRGHGKSEIGNEAFTYKQRAEDAYGLLKHLKIEKSTVFGFSDGGYSALKLASLFPQSVEMVIALGVGDNPKEKRGEPESYSSETLTAQAGDFFKGRLALMPEPDRWDESLQYLNHLYNEDFMSEETFSKIQCPVLLMNGENDEYADVDAFVQAYKYIPNANLSIIPGCGHVIFFCKFDVVWETLKGYLNNR